MTKRMVSFSMEIQLVTPVIMPAYPIHLDGLCWWALKQHLPEEHIEQAIEGLLSRDADGVFKASAMKFVVSEHKALTAHEETYSDCWKWEHGSLFGSGKQSNIRINGGPYRRRMQTWYAIHADSVAFTGEGDPAAIADLIGHSILGIGRNYRRGAGRLGNITWHERDQPFQMVNQEGVPERTIPSTSPLAVMARARPPYHQGLEEPCLVPFGIQRLIKSNDF